MEFSQAVKESMRTDRTSIVAELEKAGAEFHGNECRCPYHDDTRASAGIYQSDMGVWRFKCQAAACGFGGDYWDIRAKNENKTLGDLFRETTPAPSELPVSRDVSSRPKKEKKKPFATLEQAIAVISDQIEARYQYTNPTTGLVDLVVLRIVTDRGKTFRQVSQVSGGWAFQAPEKPWPLYNRKRISLSEFVVVVEGEKCVHCLQSYGITATTSPCGAGKAGSADWSLLAGKTVTLWPDNDEAGERHMADVWIDLEALPEPPDVRIVDLARLDLEPKEDVFDFVQQMKVAGYDRERIISELSDAVGIAKPITPAQAVGDRIEAAIAGTWSAIELPWPMLEKLTHPLLPGAIALVVGSVGHGKSFLVLQCLADFHRRGYKVGCFELEEDRTYHLSRVLAQEAGLPELVDPAWVRTNEDVARAKYAECRPFLESFGGCIWATSEQQPSLDKVADWIDSRAADGCRLVAVDPVTAADQTDKPWIADNRFLQRIKKTASASGMSIILVTHPTKAYKGPDVNQLAGSAAYSRFAQSIIWLLSHQKKDSTVKALCGTGPTEHDRTVMILKARNGRGGGLGLAFELDRETLQLKELGIIIKDKTK